MNATTEGATAGGAQSNGDGSSPSSGLPPLPFLPPVGPDGSTGASGQAGSLDGTSSRPGASYASQGRASASGSVLLSQVLGAAESLGYSVEIPPLPTHLIAADQPLRAAILAWIASTGAVVPPDELVTQLARADALPIEVQRDVALLLLSTIEASTLQRAALSRIAPEDLAWIHAHPEIAQQLVDGIDTPDTRRMAILAGFVDMPQSIAATLLVLQAVEATRGSLSDPDVGDALSTTLDDATRAILEVLAHADDAQTDAQKVRLAAKLVAIGGGIEVPEARAAPTFAAALQRLLDASGMTPSASELALVLERADALPDDLEGAIARIIEAEALAIEAASPTGLTPTSQHEALAATLVATAEALPVLEKYHLYWRNAPEALRVSEWDPAARAGWATHHIALLSTAQSDLVALVQAAELVNGREIPNVPSIPARTFVEAYEAAALAGGYPVDAPTRAAVEQAGASLAPHVRDAAATLMSAAAESARLHAEAFAPLSADEMRFLAYDARGLDTLYDAPVLTQAQIDTLHRATELAERVDTGKLAQANAVAALAMTEAKRMLEGGATLRTQGDASVVPTGLAALLARLNPLGAARAQGEDCPETLPDMIVLQCAANDMLVRIRYPSMSPGYTPQEQRAYEAMRNNSALDFTGAAYTCDTRECVTYIDGPFTLVYDDGSRLVPGGQVNRDLLVITGQSGETYLPELAPRNICAAFTTQGSPPAPTFPCRSELVPRYGAPTISIDLGGSDTYVEARAMVPINATLPVSFHLDMGGDDVYANPTTLYDARTPLLSALGANAGHPTQGSAIFGGAAMLLDAAGNDVYDAPTRSQGFGRLGVGLLADLAGDDVVTAGESSQGAAGETFTLGAGILVNVQGTDNYFAFSGQGFGLGGLFLDIGGVDRYTNQHAASGVPVADLDVLPGGQVTAFDTRADNLAWIDGPGSINVGIGIDQEPLVAGGGGSGSDRDGIPDLVEFVFGTDPRDSQDSPITNPTARATALLDDADGDGYPGYIERALSTDPEDAESYPAGLPAGAPIKIPGAVMGALGENARLVDEDQDGDIDIVSDQGESPVGDDFQGSDKILDLRLPVQDAGSITYACTGTLYLNQSAPAGGVPGMGDFQIVGGDTPVGPSPTVPGAPQPGENIFTQLGLGAYTGAQDPDTNGPAGSNERCVFVSFDPDGEGGGNATVPTASNRSTEDGADFTFKFPAGILAIGDLVPTQYKDDYFVVIDLGGNDLFENAAGGALPIRTIPRPEADETDGQMSAVNQTFFAPSVVVNVDLNSTTQGAIDSQLGIDRYLASGRDFAHGAFFGLLLDVAGHDTYIAGDASQGALGGVLLDLAGWDSFQAGALSQGAALAHQVPATNTRYSDLPGSSDIDHVNVPGLNGGSFGVNGTQRRALPGILLDAGSYLSFPQTFRAGAYSQGFGRGFYLASPASADQTQPAIGLLASLGGRDTGNLGADKYVANGRYAQAVGGNDGVGILFDLSGTDAYQAVGLVSQGATISQTVGTQVSDPSTTPRPATGVLVDLGSYDSYQWFRRVGDLVPAGVRNERNNGVTIERSETYQSSNKDGHLYADSGVHADGEFDPSNPDRFISTIGGSSDEAISTNPDDAFLVDLPTARLAIGSQQPTTYENEYAFVVDLGGANSYRNINAGGLVRETLAAADPEIGNAPDGTAPATYSAALHAYPVSLLVDGGSGDSTYTNQLGFAQGAGFFGVGILVDLGGRDTLEAVPEALPGKNSTWIETPPVIDGAIGADWDGVKAHPIRLVAQNDSRFDADWTMRVANDNRTLYLALSGRTTSGDANERYRDSLTVNFDMARMNEAWNFTNGRTGLDGVQFSFDLGTGACQALDRTLVRTSTNGPYLVFADDATNNSDWAKFDTVPRFEASCRTTDAGEVVFELRKDLVARQPFDKDDLSYCYQDGVGFGRTVADDRECIFPATDIGLYLEFMDAGAGYYEGSTASGGFPVPEPFTWPAGAVQRDGLHGHLSNANLSDEMARWGAIGLASEGHDGALPIADRAASLSHGAGIAGVGVLAMLGTAADATVKTGDRALGYGSLQGLGFLIDLGGSDRYEGGDFLLGASEGLGAGVVVELNGNENYVTKDQSVGYTPADPASSGGALFMDLGGEDSYVWNWQPTQTVDQIRGALTTSNASFVPLREGNNVAWAQNQGVGVDYRIASLVGELATDTAANFLFGSTRTNLTITKAEVNATSGKLECTTKALPKASGTDKAIVTGDVCLRATIDLDGYCPTGATSPVGERCIVGTSAFDTIRALAGEDAAAADALQEIEDAFTGPGFSDGMNVSSVDFFADRARIGTSYGTSSTSPNGRVQVWTLLVNLSGATDGVARIKAMPVFTTKMPSGEVLVFQEGNDRTNEVADSDSHKTVYINNPPQVSIDVTPEYTGIANATYSPYAYGSVQTLNTTWASSPDAGESRLALFNGWQPHPATTSLPCHGIPKADARPALCHLLPFYLTTSGELTTQPGAGIENDPRNIKTEALDSVTPYSSSTARTQTTLEIMRNESFHLTIPNRVKLLGLSEYTTEVKVKLVANTTNNAVTDANGATWYLGYAKRTAPAPAPIPDPTDLAEVPGLQQLSGVFATVNGALNNLSTGNVVWATVNQSYNQSTTCRPAATGQNIQCNQTTGHYGYGQVRFGCKAPRMTGVGATVWDQFRNAATTLDGQIAQQGIRENENVPEAYRDLSVCDGAYDNLNRTANTTGSIVPGPVNTVIGTVANATAAVTGQLENASVIPESDPGTGDPEAPNELNFQNIYFDVNPTPPNPYWVNKGVRFVGDAETGRLVIPPGFRIELEFGLLSSDGGLGRPGDNYIGLIRTASDAYNGTFAGAAQAYDDTPATGVPQANSALYGAYNTTDSTLGQQRNNGLGHTLNNVVQGGFVPSAFFTVKSGDPRDQPRLEVRVPAEPTTHLDVTLNTPLTDEVSATILSGLPVVGDRPHPQAPRQDSGDLNTEFYTQLDEEHYDWTVDPGEDGLRWTQYNVSYADTTMDDGLYVLTVKARDEAGQETVATERVILDKTAPETFITTDPFAGNAILGSAGAIPVRWFAHETASGIREVFVYARKGEDGDWVRYPRDGTQASANGFPPSQTSFAFPVSASHNTYYFMTVGVDRANNVEGSTGAANLEAALQQAFAEKLNRGKGAGYAEIFLDRNNPRFLSVGTVGGRLLEYQGSDFTFLQAGTPVEFRICVRDGDGESGIRGVNLELFPVDARHQSKAVVYAMEAAGACGANGVQYVSSKWAAANLDPVAFPEGVWRVQMQVYDQGGNTIRVSGGAVVLDHNAPTVTVDEPILPPGQTAVKPGDLVKVRLLATDAWGVDEGGIRIDASAFAKNASALTVRPVRVNGIIYQEASFTVDKPDIQNGIYEIRVAVPDLAGNTTNVVKTLAVNFRPFEFVPGSLKVTNVTHHSLELRWKTDEPTSAQVKYGTSAVTLSGRTPQIVNATKDHVVLVEGLAPSTRYHLRAVSASTGGFLKESDVIEAETTTALFLRALSPVENASVSGNVPIRFAGGLLDNAGFVTYTLEVRDGPTKPWAFVTTATRQGDEHTLFWNSTRFLDGTGYELRLTAEAGKDVASLVIAPLTSDNTPPSVLVLGPIIATNDTTPALSAEAGDSLSGFLPGNASASAVTLLVDGKPYAGALDVDFRDERLRIKSAGLEGLPAGLRTLELQVKDRAGNVAKETWKVAIDGDAPQITANPTRFSPGTAAARNGGTVTINLTLRDLSGVASVTANTSALSSAKETKLVKLVGTDIWQATFTVNDATGNVTRAIPLRAVDLAGNVNENASISVRVDNIEPRVGLTNAGDVTHTSAVLTVPADEDILVTATATAPASPPVTVSTTAPAKTAVLALQGLLPSRTYRFSVTATDLAGNPVTLTGSFPTQVDSVAPGGIGTLSVVDLLNGTLRISWPPATDDVGIAAYRVYRSEDAGATFQLVAALDTTTFEDRGLPYGKPYVYRVAALDHGGNEGPSSGHLTVAATAVPKLTAGAATPTVGTTATLFQYSVIYTSAAGKLPAYVRVVIDGVPQNMTLVSGDALSGALYVYETRLAPHKRDAPHTYAFEASDGRYAAKFPEDGSVLRGPLVSGSELSDEDIGRLAAFAQRVPMGGLAGVALAMVAAVAVAAVIRRKKEGSK